MHRSNRSHQYYDKYNKKDKDRSRGPLTFVALVILLLIAAVWIRGNRRAGDDLDLLSALKKENNVEASVGVVGGVVHRGIARQGNFKLSDVKTSSDGGGDSRIAIIIPYLGSSLPPYFPLFAWSAGGSSSLVDFFVFHAGAADKASIMNSPSNVKFIDLKSAGGFADLHAKVADPEGDDYRERLRKILTEQFNKHPYTLVEFKPAYGHIFSEYISEYSHWGYGDLDMTFGDLRSWVSSEELNDWDIVTYSHGDQGSVYLRGQFTFHKNVPTVNNVWRHCDYLSDLPSRYNLRKGENKNKYRFESAEGCYSYAALQEENIKVKYVVKAMTDFGDDDPIHQSGLKLMERSGSVVVAKPGETTDHDYFKQVNSKNVYPSGGVGEFYTEFGDLKEVKSYRQAGKVLGSKERGCMFWAPKTYQLDICAVGVSETDTVKFIDGQLYKQSYKLLEFPGGVQTSPFFHFQEWKRKYRHGQFNVIGPGGSYLIKKEGVARIPSAEDYDEDEDGGVIDLRRWQEGKEVRQDCVSFPLPAVNYCSEFANTKGDNDGKKNVHCSKTIGWFTDEVRVVKCPKQDPVSFKGQDSVTLAITVNLGVGSSKVVESRLSLVSQSLSSWHDRPAVVIIHVSNSGVDLSSLTSNRRKNLLCVVVSGSEYNRNALLNMAADAARTRYVLNGIDIESGQVLSPDSLLFIERALEGAGSEGSVWLLPHLRVGGARGDDLDLRKLGILEVAEMKREDEKQRRQAKQVELWSAEKHDECWKKCFKGTYKVSEYLNEVGSEWFDLTMSEVKMEGGAVWDSNVLESIQKTKLKIVKEVFGSRGQGGGGAVGGRAWRVPMLVDLQGPQVGLSTNRVAREMEELSGLYCSSDFLLSQLVSLGYDVKVLSGAFVSSNKATAEKGGSITCDGGSTCNFCEKVDGVSAARILSDAKVVTATTAELFGLGEL